MRSTVSVLSGTRVAGRMPIISVAAGEDVNSTIGFRLIHLRMSLASGIDHIYF